MSEAGASIKVFSNDVLLWIDRYELGFARSLY